jgi:hypothetical protein
LNCGKKKKKIENTRAVFEDSFVGKVAQKMRSVFDGSDHSQAFVSLALIATVVGSGASATVIYLIRKMGTWNLHIALILGMTVFELLYDVSFFTGVANTGSFGLSVASNMAQLQGGLTSSIFSNIIAVIALYVVHVKKTVDALGHLHYIVAAAITPGVVVNIIYLIGVFSGSHHDYADVAVLDIYYYLRLASIVFNFFCSYATAVIIHQMRSQSCSKSSSEAAISTLSMRLFYYPIVQAIGRSGCAWYEGSYGYNFDPDGGFNFNPSGTSDTQFAAQCLMVVSTPLISVGYLAIFLIMQPNALKTLGQITGCTCPSWLSLISSTGTSGADGDTRSALHKDQPSMGELSNLGRTSSVSADFLPDVESVSFSRAQSVDTEETNGNLFDMAR